MTMSPSHGRVDTHESSFGPGATVTLMSSPLHSATTSSKYDAPATYQKRTSQVLHTGVTQASGRFEMTRGVVSEQMSFSSVSAKMNPRNAADMDRQAAALGFHASNGSLLSVTEDAVHQAYQQHWWGGFVEPRYERLYRQRVWKTSRTGRRGGIVCAFFSVAFHLYLVMSSFTFQFDDNHAVPLRTLPSIVCCVGGLLIMLLGYSNKSSVIQNWNGIAFVSLTLMLLSFSSAYAALLCDFVTEGIRERAGHCTVLQAGFMPWLSAIIVIMTPIVATSVLRMGWVWSIAASLVQLVTATATSARYVSFAHMYQAVVVMSLSIMLTIIGAQVREMAERSFWASLHHTARAQFLQETAERIQRDTELKREAADARSTAAQSVMRYVCHELRNPLHGIMGLLEGVKGELEELEPWVADDVDTITNAATSMSVILNDVLDLGQLQRGAMELNPVSTDVVALIDRCVLTLQGITTVPIVSHIAASLPDLVTLDPLRVGQIMTNAISNAAKLTTEGSVELVAQVRDAKFWFEVFDTGPGLSGDGARLFEAYTQDTTGTARTTRNRFDKGTGLGLPIAAQLVRLMGGDIGLENRSDGVHGARFWFWVPSPEPPRPPGIPAVVGGVVPVASAAALNTAWSHTESLAVDGAQPTSIDVEPSGRALSSRTSGTLTAADVADGYLVHVLTPAAGSPQPLSDAKKQPSVASIMHESARKHATHKVHRTGAGASHKDVERSILTSSPNHGAVEYRDHRSYGRGSVSSGESKMSITSLASGMSYRSGMSTRSGPSRGSGGSGGSAGRAVADVTPDSASHCGNCSGCRGCTCCERAHTLSLFTVNAASPAAVSAGGLSASGPVARAGVALVTRPSAARVTRESRPPLEAVLEGKTPDAVAPRTVKSTRPSWRPAAPQSGTSALKLVTMSSFDIARTLVDSPVHAKRVGGPRSRAAGDATTDRGDATRGSAATPAADRAQRDAPLCVAVMPSLGASEIMQVQERTPVASAGPGAGLFGTAVRSSRSTMEQSIHFSTRAWNDAASGAGAPAPAPSQEAGAAKEAPAGGATNTNVGSARPKRARRARKAKKKGPQAPKEFTGVHVLVVDDERVNRTVLKRYCTKVGCTVRMMEDGDELLAVLDKHGTTAPDTGGLPDSEQDDGREWDLIFLDICMQRSNGEDVCRRLRAAGVRTPLVAATGNAVREDLERYTVAGFNTVMLKPFNGTTVADVMRSLVVKDAEATS